MDKRKFWRRFKLAIASLPVHHRISSRPAFFYKDVGQGDEDQGLRLTDGRFCLDHHEYKLSLSQGWQGRWPFEVRKWLYSFVWLRDLKALGTNEARLRARGLIHIWCEKSPKDELAQDGYLMGQRLANWLGHYEFCLETATEQTKKQVLEVMLREGRILAALLPLPVQGWEGLAALRGLLAAFMVLPEQQGFLLRFQRYLKPELERLILSDGTVAERSPEAQFQTVRELQNFVAMYSAMEVSVPFLIAQALEKTCPVLDFFRHGDGKLALFNGTLEHEREEIQSLFENMGRHRVLPPVLPQGGFARIVLGRSLLLIDAARPPVFGFDSRAHAGALSFEFSHGAQRFFVNCGAARGGAWKEALRISAAHNTLTAEGESCVEFGPDGHITRHPSHVSHNYKNTEGEHWINLSHDGYHAPLGAVWSRSLYLGKDGEDLRGQEQIEGERDLSCTLRFHIHPTVRVEQEDDEVMLHTEGSLWRFRQSGGKLRIEDDIYLGRGKPEPAKQIVLTSKAGEIVKGDDDKPHHFQKIIWVFERVPD